MGQQRVAEDERRGRGEGLTYAPLRLLTPETTQVILLTMASIRQYLDLRKAPWNAREHNIYKARTRAVAQDFARVHGWPVGDRHIHPACSHIDAWWVIGQCDGDEMTFLRKDGSVVKLPWPGYVTR